MPRKYFTEQFKLGLTQPEVDFVDIDLNGDLPLFIDPYFLAQRTDAWSYAASRTIRNFFEHFIRLIRAGKEAAAYDMFSHLHEPNETRLGLSRRKPKGRGVGSGDSRRIYDSLRESKAVKTGMVEHLEDCRLFIPGIDKDKTSDITTNIIRRHLLEYTRVQCRNHGILLTQGPSGFMWSITKRQWENEFCDILVVGGQKILLVPKGIVSYSLTYSTGQYHQHFVLNFLQHEHLRLGTVLVQRNVRKDGSVREFVTKKSLAESVAPLTKEFVADFTEGHPEVFRTFKGEAASKQSSLGNHELTAQSISDVAEHLLTELTGIKPGSDDSTRFEKTIAAILEFLFYPQLIAPELQVKLHAGRKRIDIVYDNAAIAGFFKLLHSVHKIPCQFVFIECKNYREDPKNPELDQLAGRFAPNRGRFGILVCRSISDIDEFMLRCSDTYKDDRGLIIPLVDQDLAAMLKAVKNHDEIGLDRLLGDRLRQIAFS
jgi:hypothetical protein